jgi:DNA-binding ferritin-like protein
MRLYLDAIEEVTDVAQAAEDITMGARRDVPMLTREKKEKGLLRPAKWRRPSRARANPSTASYPLLVSVLAHLRALQWLYWTTHWTTQGPNFYGQHLLLQRLYEGKKGGPNINEQIDQLGERLVAYFGAASINPVLIQQQATTLLERVQGGEPVAALMRLEEHLQRAVRAAWDAEQQAGSSRSLGLDDYLMGLANERDTARYLLGQVVGANPNGVGR